MARFNRTTEVESPSAGRLGQPAGRVAKHGPTPTSEIRLHYGRRPAVLHGASCPPLRLLWSESKATIIMFGILFYSGLITRPRYDARYPLGDAATLADDVNWCVPLGLRPPVMQLRGSTVMAIFFKDLYVSGRTKRRSPVVSAYGYSPWTQTCHRCPSYGPRGPRNPTRLL